MFLRHFAALAYGVLKRNQMFEDHTFGRTLCTEIVCNSFIEKTRCLSLYKGFMNGSFCDGQYIPLVHVLDFEWGRLLCTNWYGSLLYLHLYISFLIIQE